MQSCVIDNIDCIENFSNVLKSCWVRQPAKSILEFFVVLKSFRTLQPTESMLRFVWGM